MSLSAALPGYTILCLLCSRFYRRLELKKVKLLVALVFIVGAGVNLVGDAMGYPPFLVKARKFGAKDCTFCHVNIEGGEPWNERGQWLMAEKDRRKADVVDPAWLADYKPGKPVEQKEQKDAASVATQTASPKKIDPKVFDDYLGDYELPMFVLTITKEGERLFGQPPGDTKEELIPESETEFNVTNVNAKVKFVRDEKGKVTHIVVNLNGETFEGKKIK
jgi:hypothetical protein